MSWRGSVDWAHFQMPTDKPNRQRAVAIMERSGWSIGAPNILGRHTGPIRLPVVGGFGSRYSPRGLTVPVDDIVRRIKYDRQRPLELDIDSEGGIVFEAMKIYSALDSHMGPITARVEKRCHSAAGIVLMGATERVSGPRARYLVHSPGWLKGDHNFEYWNSVQLRKWADSLDVTDREVTEILIKGCGGNREKIEQLLAKGEYIGPWQAAEAGLIHKIAVGGRVLDVQNTFKPKL